MLLDNQRNPPSQEQPTSNVKSRDDRQILERLTQQANKFSTSDRLPITRDSNPFQNLELALSSTGTFGENLDRHGRRIRIPESEVRCSRFFYATYLLILEMRHFPLRHSLMICSIIHIASLMIIRKFCRL